MIAMMAPPATIKGIKPVIDKNGLFPRDSSTFSCFAMYVSDASVAIDVPVVNDSVLCDVPLLITDAFVLLWVVLVVVEVLGFKEVVALVLFSDFVDEPPGT
mgnify:CR=1 FL=1